MKLKRILHDVTTDEDNKIPLEKPDHSPIHNFVALSACAALAMILAVGSKAAGSGERSQVYAASDAENETELAGIVSGTLEYTLPTGIAGMVTSVADTPLAGSAVTRIGTSCENVMVGQRVKKVTGNADELDVGDSMADTVDSFDAAVSVSSSAKMMSDSDYDNLLHIVEAEAGTEDIKGKVLIANVIMNRVANKEFPNTVTDVIMDRKNGVPQFSPIYDGRFYEVTVTDETKEAVKQALEGVDYSQGALFFIQRSAAEKQNVVWFDKDLKKLFKYGVHEFYTYPDENDSGKDGIKDSGEEADVQLAKK